MKIIHRVFPLITFLFFPFIYLNGQLNAEFSMDPSSGCSNLVVDFTNQSTGYDSLIWYFGDQLGTSTLENPKFTYINPGTYQVKLVVFNLSQKDSATNQIVVYRNPTADFTANQKGCVPHLAQFDDNSSVGDGQITSWDWDFGTGTLIHTQNPSRSYATPGEYNVLLKVTDIHGCFASVYKPEFIDVVAPPVPDFTFTPASTCLLPANISFTNASTGDGNFTHIWNFGDGTNSIQVNPSKTYNNFNNYLVTLETTTDYGCSTDTVKTVYVNEVRASGVLTQNSKTIQSGDTICSGIVNFESTSTGTASVRWLFGDNLSSISKTGFHNYTVNGNRTITLIASPGNQCADTTTWDVYFEKPEANFTLSPGYSCKTPVLVAFTNTTAGDYNCEWTFPDGQTSTTKNTSHTINLPPETDPYIIHGDILLSTSLSIESPHGCTSTATKSIRIRRPTALYSVDVDTGCSPLQVKFTDLSLSDETVISKTWVFGDASTSSSTAATVNHSYVSHGNYASYLIISNNAGCSDTSYIRPIQVGKKLLPDFSVNQGVVCPHETVLITNTTPESNLIEEWYYFINDSIIDKNYLNPNPSWVVIPDTGYMDVKLEIRYNGCVSDTIKSNVLYNKGPVSLFEYSLDCGSPLEYSFTNKSKGYTSFKWEIGNVVNTITVNPDYTFASQGDSLVKLITYKETCSDTSNAPINIRNVQAVISVDTLLCSDFPIGFDGSLSYTFPNQLTDNYEWFFENLLESVITDNDIVYNIFEDRGYQNVKLKASYDNGCIDSASIKVRVFEPYADYSADPVNGCPPLFVTFADSSLPDVHPIEKWVWTFEQDDDSTYFSQIPEIIHRFNNPGAFNVSLEVTDTFGCIGLHEQVISSGNPDAQFLVDDTTLCVGMPVSFYSIPQEIDSLRWDFGNGAVSGSLTRPLAYSYQNEGEYTPTLTLYRFGCSDSFTLPLNQIKVQEANAYFTVTDTFWNCYPKVDTFKYSLVADSGVWYFGISNSYSNIISEPQVFTYPLPGTYTPNLRVVTSFGCRDTFEREVVITGPTGSFSLSDQAICRFDEVKFVVTDTNDVYNYEWDFGDGSPFIKADTISHFYTDTGSYYPKLLLWGDPLGTCKPAVVDTVSIYRVVADFSIPDTGLCEQYLIEIINNSEGNDTNYWNFNNTNFSNEIDLQFNLSPGDYFAELMVKSKEGCSDTLLKSFTIHPLPVMTIMEDTLICEGDTGIIWAKGGDQILWSPASGLSAVNVYNPVILPLISTTYTATVRENIFGCQNSNQIYIFVQPSPDYVLSPPLDSVIIGDTFRIALDSLGDFIYAWTPDYMINCTNCASPIVQPLETTQYSLLVTDTNNCFSETYYINIPVRKSFIIALPSAFTPTGENELNRVIKVRGHGIKNLLEFRIYNRWGNEVFYTDDINLGWDGFYKDKLQPIDAYGYIVIAEMWDGTVQTKKGTINLLR